MSGGYSEDDVRRAAETREWLIKQISDKQEELERLRTMLTLVDSLLKQGSFRPASMSPPATQESRMQTAAAPSPLVAAKQQAMAAAAPQTRPQQQQQQQQSSFEAGKEVRQIKRAKDEAVLANAEVTAASVTITPAVPLNANTPPFRSFFLNRILDGMKGKDAEKVSQGAIKPADAINYVLEEDKGSGTIKKITISNYRDRDRLQEIFNTSAWVFTRMLEKAGSG